METTISTDRTTKNQGVNAEVESKRYCLFALDVETTSIWHNCLRDSTGKRVADEAVPRILEMFAEKEIETTFFVTGYFARLFPECVKKISERGHEIGSHSLYHDKHHGHDVTDLKTQINHLSTSKQILEDITGQEVISFRAPALRVNEFTGIALAETGFKIDSSIASQRFDMFLSFGAFKKLKWMFAPRLPYRTAAESLFRKGNGPITEIPLSALFAPYLGTTMRIFPGFTQLQHHLVHLENKLNGKPVVFDFHPNEIVDERDEPRKIANRSSNAVAYFLQDFLRAKLKQRNLGDSAFHLYEREINYFLGKGYNFTSLKNFCKEKGFIN